MKNIITTIILAFSAASAFAQYVEMGEKPMSTGVNDAFTVDILGADEKAVQKEWSDFMKDFSGKTKRDRKSGEMRTERAAIGGIGGDVIAYATTTELGSKVKHTAWFESDGMFVSSGDKTKADIIVGVMERFIIHMKRVQIEEELDAEEKAMKDLQRELDKEEKNEERQHSNIEKYEQQIQEAEANIVESQEMQKQKAEEIESQQDVIEAVKVRLNNVGLGDDKMEEEEEMPVFEDSSIEEDEK